MSTLLLSTWTFLSSWVSFCTVQPLASPRGSDPKEARESHICWMTQPEKSQPSPGHSPSPSPESWPLFQRILPLENQGACGFPTSPRLTHLPGNWWNWDSWIHSSHKHRHVCLPFKSGSHIAILHWARALVHKPLYFNYFIVSFKFSVGKKTCSYNYCKAIIYVWNNLWK